MQRSADTGRRGCRNVQAGGAEATGAQRQRMEDTGAYRHSEQKMPERTDIVDRRYRTYRHGRQKIKERTEYRK